MPPFPIVLIRFSLILSPKQQRRKKDLTTSTCKSDLIWLYRLRFKNATLKDYFFSFLPSNHTRIIIRLCSLSTFKFNSFLLDKTTFIETLNTFVSLVTGSPFIYLNYFFSSFIYSLSFIIGLFLCQVKFLLYLTCYRQYMGAFSCIFTVIPSQITNLTSIFVMVTFPRPKGNPRQPWILDSTPWITDSRYCISDSLSVKLGFQIRVVSGIPDSLSCMSDSKAQDSGFHEQNFLRFRIPDSLTLGETFPV